MKIIALLYNCPEIVHARRYPYCSKPLREKDTLKFRHIFGRGKKEREGCRKGNKDDFFRFTVFSFSVFVLTYLPNIFSIIYKRILSTFYPLPCQIIMATFAQFPRRSSVSAIAEEWDMIVRLWTLRKHSDKQRDIYTHKRQPLFLRKTVKVKVSNSRTQRQVNKCLILQLI